MTKAVIKGNMKSVKAVTPVATLASLNGYTAEEWITRTEISRMCNPAFDMAMYVEELDESLG